VWHLPMLDQGYERNVSSAAIIRGSGIVQARPQSSTAITKVSKAPPSAYLSRSATPPKDTKNAMVGTIAALALAALKKAHRSSFKGTLAPDHPAPPGPL